MDNNVAIQLEHVSKKYCKDIRNAMIYGMTDIGRNLVGLKSCSGNLRKNEFWAVNDVSFEVNRGETLGIIGPNGSGKTTLLKMLNGIFWPDKGKISVKGKVGALIAVGAGFHPQLSGRENIYINGAILGMSRKEIEKKFDAIVDFADIGDFLDSPVRHYSSGMYVRLGFAIAVHSQTDILLIDEVLAVGDINFQAKCINKIKELDHKGVSKIFISHNLDSVQMICNRTLYLSRGKVQLYGNTQDVLAKFKKDAFEGRDIEVNSIRSGTREIEITKVQFLDKNLQVKKCFKRGEPFTVRIFFNAKKSLEAPELSIGFCTEDGTLISKATTRDHGITIDRVQGEGEICYSLKSLPFNLGKYLVSVAFWDSTGLVPFDHQEKMYELSVEEGAIDDKIRERYGYVHIPAQWNIDRAVAERNA